MQLASGSSSLTNSDPAFSQVELALKAIQNGVLELISIAQDRYVCGWRV